jgi:tetratricopeptide (TPR) repeat protein
MKRKGFTLPAFLFTVFLCLPVFLSTASASSDYDLFIAQGIEKINANQFSEALELLNKALEAAPDDPEALFYSGVALSRMGDHEKAEKLFSKVLRNKEYTANAYLELGRIYFTQGMCSKSIRYLKKYLKFEPESSLAAYAGNMIDECRTAMQGGEEDDVNRLTVTAGVEYDSNVILESDNPPIVRPREDDWRAVGLVDARAVLYKNDVLKVKGKYKLYQSAHQHLSTFNVNYHLVSPSIELTVSDLIKPSIGYRLEYIPYFGGDDYGRFHTAFAKVKIRETDRHSLDGIYEYRDITYWNTRAFTGNALRTGHQNTAGVRQHFTYNRLDGNVYYFYDDKRASANHWSYIADRGGIMVQYKISDPLRVKGSAEFMKRDYRGIVPGTGLIRSDDTQHYTLSLQYQLNEKMALTFTERFTKNDSNIVSYDYDRNVLGLLFTYGII